MSKVELPETRDIIVDYINNIIKSSQRIIEEEQSLFDFLDEAIREAEEDIADSDAENNYSNTDLIGGKSRSMETMEGVVSETMGDDVSRVPQVNGVDDSADVKEEMSPVTAGTESEEQTTDDVHVLTTDKDDTSSLDDSVVGRKKEIEKYVQEIIKEAQQKVDKDEADINGTQAPEVNTAEVADGKETGTENNNAPATVVADKETKEVTENENGGKSASHPNNEEPRNTEESQGMDIEEDNLLNQKHFIEVNSKDTGRKKRSGGRFHRIRKSMSNLFSCTSSNTKEVT